MNHFREPRVGDIWRTRNCPPEENFGRTVLLLENDSTRGWFSWNVLILTIGKKVVVTKWTIAPAELNNTYEFVVGL